MTRRVIHLTLGTASTGLWCPACLLPSGVEIPLNIVGKAGVSRVGLLRICADCERPIPINDQTGGDQ